MKLKIFLMLAMILMAANINAAQRVRRVEVNKDQIVTVKTSLGIATIIQVPDRPNSVVVGDQDAFKVEYLDQAITIKPLSGGAKSNLYIYTDWKRYNVELVSGAEAIADYVVYLETPKEKPAFSSVKSNISWMKFSNTLRNDNLTLNVTRVGRTKESILLVEFTITSKTKETFKPEWLWLTQNDSVKPIHNLFLSALEVTPQRSLSGVLQLKATDIDPSQSMRLEMRRSRMSYLTITKAQSWRP